MTTKLLKILTVAFLTVQAQGASAVFMPDYHRPIQTSEVQSLEATGTLNSLNQVEIVLAKLDGSKMPTAIYLKSDSFRDPMLIVNEVLKDECGNTLYLAQAMVEESLLDVTLRDTRLGECSDTGSIWEVEMTQSNDQNQVTGEAILIGNPENVFTIQIQQSLF